MQITLIPCLSDNYAYLIEAGDAVAVVDPSEPDPVIRAVEAKGRRVTQIWNTHHHFDHTGGNLALKEKYGAQVFAPAADSHRIPGFDHGLKEGDTAVLGPTRWRILEIPAHTSGHIAYWCADQASVFTGDTMFAMGCGRLFEGPPEQMWASLSKLAALPPDTRVYCGHEYTQANGAFALSVDAANKALHDRMQEVKRLRAQGLPTIPSTIAQERATNPFLRAGAPELAAAVDMSGAAPAAVFAELRKRKDNFK